MTKDIKYIGAVSLLGLLSARYRADEEDIDLVRRAMNDLVEEFPGRFEVVKVCGGFSLEPKMTGGFVGPVIRTKDGVVPL